MTREFDNHSYHVQNTFHWINVSFTGDILINANFSLTCFNPSNTSTGVYYPLIVLICARTISETKADWWLWLAGCTFSLFVLHLPLYKCNDNGLDQFILVFNSLCGCWLGFGSSSGVELDNEHLNACEHLPAIWYRFVSVKQEWRYFVVFFSVW